MITFRYSLSFPQCAVVNHINELVAMIKIIPKCIVPLDLSSRTKYLGITSIEKQKAYRPIVPNLFCMELIGSLLCAWELYGGESYYFNRSSSAPHDSKRHCDYRDNHNPKEHDKSI